MRGTERVEGAAAEVEGGCQVAGADGANPNTRAKELSMAPEHRREATWVF